MLINELLQHFRFTAYVLCVDGADNYMIVQTHALRFQQYRYGLADVVKSVPTLFLCIHELSAHVTKVYRCVTLKL